tara:strand:+ start:198876 stop:199016 length:141 start_codon:yes stop_codon:yes gene_type:complete
MNKFKERRAVGLPRYRYAIYFAIAAYFSISFIGCVHPVQVHVVGES